MLAASTTTQLDAWLISQIPLLLQRPTAVSRR